MEVFFRALGSAEGKTQRDKRIKRQAIHQTAFSQHYNNESSSKCIHCGESF